MAELPVYEIEFSAGTTETIQASGYRFEEDAKFVTFYADLGNLGETKVASYETSTFWAIRWKGRPKAS